MGKMGNIEDGFEVHAPFASHSKKFECGPIMVMQRRRCPAKAGHASGKMAGCPMCRAKAGQPAC
jgi:hypothetical protein